MVESIVRMIDEEIARLEKVKGMLTSGEPQVRRRGRPAKSNVVAATQVAKPRRRLSAKARKAIADAQRKRWAAKKAATSKTS